MIPVQASTSHRTTSKTIGTTPFLLFLDYLAVYFDIPR